MLKARLFGGFPKPFCQTVGRHSRERKEGVLSSYFSHNSKDNIRGKDNFAALCAPRGSEF